jgi:RimJ/RimL family protein N-acetyltransferase
MLKPSKSYMLESLPIQVDGFTIRHWNRNDLDELAAWPIYPFPDEGFVFSFKEKTPEERDRLFRSREDRTDTMVLIIDHASHRAMGYISLQEIEWINGEVENIGFRIEPSWCNRGIGTLVLRSVSRWCLDCGLRKLRLDVAASNDRAVRCYEKMGFVRTGELWREAADMKGVDLNQPTYDFLRPHMRHDGAIPQIRFWWMELRHMRA